MPREARLKFSTSQDLIKPLCLNWRLPTFGARRQRIESKFLQRRRNGLPLNGIRPEGFKTAGEADTLAGTTSPTALPVELCRSHLASLLGVLSPSRPAGATLAFPLSDDGGAAFGLTITPVLVLLSDLVAAAPPGDCP